MKALLQRVEYGIVRVAGEEVGRCGRGLLIFLGVVRGDESVQARRLARRTAEFRCFADDRGRMNRSALEVGGEALVISQVTLAQNARKGRRPSFDGAAEPALAETLWLEFARTLEELGLATQRGRFGAHMSVESVNDGPVTFLLEEGS